MTERDDELSTDERVDAVLAALSTAQPMDGFEQRITRRLANAPARAPRFGLRWPRLVLAGGAAAAVLVLTVMMWMRHEAPAELNANESGGAQVSAALSARSSSEAVSAKRNALASAVVPRRETASSDAVRHRAAKENSTRRQDGKDSSAVATANDGAYREASFPAPAMPLTEQERLLLRIAHRNDPEEIAMLDPVARDLQLARERAESAKFFAPEPLPPEMQKEIKAALRSQYVNTPPPRELLDPTSDRSTR